MQFLSFTVMKSFYHKEIILDTNFYLGKRGKYSKLEAEAFTLEQDMY